MEVPIRFADLRDLPVLLAHRRGMFRDMKCEGEEAMLRMLAASERFLRETLADGSGRAWIAEAEGRIAGSGAVHILPWVPGFVDPTPRRAYVYNLYVEPEFRRRGIARQLMETIVAWCREAQFHTVTLHASDQGRPLYEAMGFTAANEMRLLL